MVRPLLAHISLGHPVQFPVHQGGQLLQGMLISVAPGLQQMGYFVSRDPGHTSPSDSAESNHRLAEQLTTLLPSILVIWSCNSQLFYKWILPRNVRVFARNSRYRKWRASSLQIQEREQKENIHERQH